MYPGPEGKARFQQQIRELVKLRDDEEFEVEFECKAPDSGGFDRCWVYQGIGFGLMRGWVAGGREGGNDEF